MIIVTRLGIVLCLGLFAILPTLSSAEDSPHWNKSTCATCHVDANPVPGNINVRESDIETLCESCHGDRGDARSCRHGSGLAVGDMSIAGVLKSSLKSGEVVCSTCHDIAYQCEHPTVQYSFHNPGFLRDRTSRDTGQYCFECHESSDYEELNPHQGVTGTPPRPSCQLCHANVPETSAAGELIVEFNMQHDLNDMCKGCHEVRPHPKSMSFGAPSADEEWIHLVAPSTEVLQNMSESEAETGIGLPFNPPNGEVFRAACHNPHDFGVSGEHRSQAIGMKHRLRQHDICQACHDK